MRSGRALARAACRYLTELPLVGRCEGKAYASQLVKVPQEVSTSAFEAENQVNATGLECTNRQTDLLVSEDSYIPTDTMHASEFCLSRLMQLLARLTLSP